MAKNACGKEAYSENARYDRKCKTLTGRKKAGWLGASGPEEQYDSKFLFFFPLTSHTWS